MTDFDAAIRVLRGHIKWAFFHRSCYPPCEGPDFRGDVGECHAAIRVLEAAEKVDKIKARGAVSWIDSPFSVHDEGRDDLFLLISSLPDEEK